MKSKIKANDNDGNALLIIAAYVKNQILKQKIIMVIYH